MPRAYAALLILSAMPPAAAQQAPQRNHVAVEYGHTRFSADFDPWHLAFVEAGRRFDRVAVIARATSGYRFNDQGWQVEADAYPVLGPRTYAYLNAGIGLSGAFPDWRVGAELYRGLPRGWEASLGLRHLRFPGTRVTLYTGSLAKYRGPWWIAARPFLSVGTAGTSFTGVVSLRRYLGSSDAFVGLQGSLGSAPVDVITVADFLRTTALQVRGDAQIRVRGSWWAGGFGGFERETLPGRTRTRATLGVRTLHRF